MRQKKNPSAFLPRTPPGSGQGEGHRGYPQDPTNASPSPCRSGFRTGGPSSAVTRGRCWPTGQRHSSSPTAKKPPSSSPWHRGPRRSAPSTSPGPAPPRTGGCRHRQGQGTGAGTVPTSRAALCCCRGHGELCRGQRSQGQELTGVCSGNPHQPCLHILCPLQSSLHAFWGRGGLVPTRGPPGLALTLPTSRHRGWSGSLRFPALQKPEAGPPGTYFEGFPHASSHIKMPEP